VVLVSVWAAWCEACREELPVLSQAPRRHPGLQVVGLDFRDDDSAARDLIQAVGAEQVQSVADRDGRVGIAWGVLGVPESFLVDRDGTVRARRIGPVDESWLRLEADPLLARTDQVRP
jgi:cytochrome c biogenesis protein CcmG/thiol:disulfide interchange protein DsbE